MTTGSEQGFTLLEILIVIAIMAMLAAMAYPAVGLLDDRERARITTAKMVEIRRAIVGDPDRFDDSGLRIIGGYVGDLEAWPDLWEAAPEVRGHVAGAAPDFDPAVATTLDYYLYRPTGTFSAGVWHWTAPFRLLTDDTTFNNDHIGGLETENEGQPRGLWTDNVAGDFTVMLDNERWRGPYLVPPTDDRPADGDTFAKDDYMYTQLEPAYQIATSKETWEDGDYGTVSGERGEHYDDKEDFRLLQNNGRLADGWQRSFRFFITADPEHSGATLFWIVSEGPDGEGAYPSKGSHDGSNWTVDAVDTMAENYDENDEYNQDNMVMKISSREWRAVIAANNARKKEETQALIARVGQALVGRDLPPAAQFNSGYTGDLCAWPGLFNWEGTSWDDEDDTPGAYTKGQPRGLWTGTPNSADSGDDLAALTLAGPGLGWYGPYIQAPTGTLADEALLDAWGRPLLFFRDAGHDSLLILSRGADGLFDFYDTDTLPAAGPDGTPDYREPAGLAEAVDLSTYDPADSGGYNADNVVKIIRAKSWKPGWFTLENLTVYNATVGVTKAAFHDGLGPAAGQVAVTLTDEDGDSFSDDWGLGGPAPNEAFAYDDTSGAQVCLGRRRLLVWNDADGNDSLDSGEHYFLTEYSVVGHGGLEPRPQLTLDTATDFTLAP